MGLITLACSVCGNEIRRYSVNVRPGHAIYCSRVCMSKGFLARTSAPAEHGLPARFWAKVKKLPGGCWEWTGTLTTKGYGKFSVKADGVNKYVYTHRLLFESINGDIPNGMFVCHSCDNPACCNPKHLWLGTNQDNQRDSVSKRRHKESRKTHCSNGHEFSPENTIRYGRRRYCRICAAMREALRPKKAKKMVEGVGK